jgi:transketolase
VTVLAAPGLRELHDCRDAYVATLIDLARADPRIVAVVNDSVGSSKLGPFQSEFPERLINVGIAEQDMVGVAAGLANGGKIPFVSAAACFLTARAMEQIKIDAAYSRRHLVLCGMSPGMAYGELGPTHHSIEDIGWLRTIPGLTVLVPADPAETVQCIRWAAQYEGPVYVRVSRMGVPDVFPADYEFAVGRASTLRDGSDVTIIARWSRAHWTRPTCWRVRGSMPACCRCPRLSRSTRSPSSRLLDRPAPSSPSRSP